MLAKKIVVATIAAAGALLTGAAQARSDWSIHLDLPLPPLPSISIRPPAPVYGPPPAVYAPPPAVYAPAPVYYPPPRAYYPAPRPVYYGGYGYGDRDHDGVPNRWDRYDNRRHGGWDRDHDGVPNRRDHHDGRDDRGDGRWDRGDDRGGRGH